MTQQAVIETEPAESTLTEEEPTDTAAAGGSGPSGSGVSPGHTVSPRASTEALVAEELLVEEVSIDGMCGVY
jgi:mycofactocin precursor